MADSKALRRYRQRHGERALPGAPAPSRPWHNALVVPAYRESPGLLDRLDQAWRDADPVLVILLLNRPDSDPDEEANTPLRNALNRLPAGGRGASGCRRLNRHTDIYCHDLERLAGPTPAPQGVGLARKTGCDIALDWIGSGAIASDWIGTTDADATLPPDYFSRLDAVSGEAVAAVFPFEHLPGPDPLCDRATALYELRLHHYVLGLEYAGSPYAHHSLGSCTAVRSGAYAAVRGFPRRAGGEDFYLLNKLRKLGPVARLAGEVIRLQSRASNRVPFGTGPAVSKIAADANPPGLPLFYHPACFEVLRAALNSIPEMRDSPISALPGLLRQQGLPPALAAAGSEALQAMGLEAALQHCRRHGRTGDQFRRQFHQWFDAFRSLKFIHAMRDAGWPDLALTQLREARPALWPPAGPGPTDIETLRRGLRRRWQWRGT